MHAFGSGDKKVFFIFFPASLTLNSPSAFVPSTNSAHKLTSSKVEGTTLPLIARIFDTCFKANSKLRYEFDNAFETLKQKKVILDLCNQYEYINTDICDL